MTDAELTRLEALAASATKRSLARLGQGSGHRVPQQRDPAGRDAYTIADTSAEVRRLRVAERFAKASLAVEDRPGLMPRP